MTDEFDAPARRRVLKAIGATALASGLAGCGGDGGDGSDGGDGTTATDADGGTDTPAGTTPDETATEPPNEGTETTDEPPEQVDPLGDTAWPMTGYDAGYTNAHPNVAALGGELTERWTVERSVENRGGYQDLPIAVGSGHVVTASPGGTVVAFDATDGTEAWTYDVGERGPPSGGITLFDDVVYVASGADDEPKYALDVETGEVRWENADGGDFDPVVYDGRLYELGLNEVYARDLQSGDVLWEVRRVAGVRNLAVADGTLYTQVEREPSDWQVLAIDAASGDERWVSDGVSLDGPRPTHLSADAEGVYVTGGDGTVWAFDAAGGSLDWTVNHYTPDETGSVKPEQPAVVGPDNVYIGGYNLHALSRADGSEQWAIGEQYDTRDTVAYADGEVYQAFDPGLVAYDPADGSELWSVEIPVDPGCVADVAVTDGAAYLATDDCASAEPSIAVLEVDE